MIVPAEKILEDENLGAKTYCYAVDFSDTHKDIKCGFHAQDNASKMTTYVMTCRRCGAFTIFGYDIYGVEKLRSFKYRALTCDPENYYYFESFSSILLMLSSIEGLVAHSDLDERKYVVDSISWILGELWNYAY